MTPPPPEPRFRSSDRTPWVVAGSALFLVVMITVGAMWFTSDGPDDTPPQAAPPPPSPSVNVSEIASADDEDPVRIITDEPTCPDWEPINTGLNTVLGNGWQGRDPAVPATEWSDQQRAQHRAVADAMRAAADKVVPLAKATPHRVMRELYGQTVAYWRAYADSVDAYRPPADHLARAATNGAEAVNAICAAIDFGAAGDRGPLVLPGPPPVPAVPLGDPNVPAKFIAGPSAFCNEWVAMVSDYANATREWRGRHDPNIPASYWSPEQRKLNDDVATTMQRNADRAQLLGLLSGNLVAADFAALSAHYRQAYALALPTYALPDTHLNNAALRLQALTNQSCQAVGK